MRLISIVVFLTIVLPVYAQNQADRIESMKSFASSMTNIEPESFKDHELEFLKNAIGDKRIVFLGENSHVDGSTLRAKSKVIKYLHEEMGFDFLLIEKGFYETDRAWRDLLAKRDEPLSVFANLMDIFRVFISLHEKNLYEYIGEQAFTDAPLRIGGIDIIESSTSYAWGESVDLKTILDDIYGDEWPNEIVKQYKIAIKTYDIAKGEIPVGFGQKKIESNLFFISEFERFLKNNEKIASDRKELILFMIQALKSGNKWQYWGANKPKRRKTKGQVLADYFTLRDKYMAENLIWYLERYPEKKVIVSTSTYHISRNVQNIEPRPKMLGNDAVPMGHYVWNQYGDDIYSIAFVSYKGHFGSSKRNVKVKKIPKRKKGGIEHVMHLAGIKFGFLDLRTLPEEMGWVKNAYLNPTFLDSYKTDWSRIYDGLFFIDEMRPDESFGYVPNFNRPPPYLPAGAGSVH